MTQAPVPIVKWAGGKRRLAEQIIQALPSGELGTYHEPFVGGAAVYLALWSAGRITGASAAGRGRARELLIRFW